MFALIHSISTEHDIVTRIAHEVLVDFAADNVVHLELRTTPKVSMRALIQLLIAAF